MTKPSSFFLFSALTFGTVLVVEGCGSDSCEDTDSCGNFPRAGANNAGTSAGGGGAGSSATGGTGGASGSPATGGNAGTGGELGGESGAGAIAGRSGNAGQSGTSGEGGSEAGSAGSAPCDGACKGSTPVCDTKTDDCVECTKNAHCHGSTPVCDTSSSTCVECTKSDATHCDEDTPLCDTSSAQCVACLESSDCSSATAAKCNGDNACVACTSDDDCNHLSVTKLCNSGTCVQCTPADESACGANSCNPATHTCTETARGSVTTCEPCLADSECQGGNQADPDMRCVPMQFQGTARDGGFCLRRVAKTCQRPYLTVLTSQSLSGAPSEGFCGIPQALTRCEAVLDFFRAMTCEDTQDSSCGCARDDDHNCLAPGAGGLCRTVGPLDNQCSYPCGTDNDCPPGKTCTGSSVAYCQ